MSDQLWDTPDQAPDSATTAAHTGPWDDPAWANPNGLGAVLGDQCPRCGYTRRRHHPHCPTHQTGAPTP